MFTQRVCDVNENYQETVTVNWAKIVSTGGTVSLSGYLILPMTPAGSCTRASEYRPAKRTCKVFNSPRAKRCRRVRRRVCPRQHRNDFCDDTLKSSGGTTLATKSLTLGSGVHTPTFAKDFWKGHPCGPGRAQFADYSLLRGFAQKIVVSPLRGWLLWTLIPRLTPWAKVVSLASRAISAA